MDRRKKRIKQTAVFLVSALLVCFAASLFLTEPGIAKLYPLAVRGQVEEIVPSGNSYTVYHGTRASVSSAEGIVVGVDPDISQSYDVLGHFFRFAKQYSEIGVVLLPIEEEDVAAINEFWLSESTEIQRTRTELLASMPQYSVDFIDFITELAYVNATVTPARKFTAVSYRSEDGANAAEVVQKNYNNGEEKRRTCFVVADIEWIENGNLERDLETLYGEGLMTVKTRYSGKDYSGESKLQLPFVGETPKCWYVSGSGMSGFNHYANRVLNFFRDGDQTDYGEKISGVRSNEFFFVISNGTDITYEETEETT